jgi:N-methylhydantoinase A
MLTAPISFDFVRTKIMKLDDLDADTLNVIYTELEAEGQSMLDRSGVPKNQMEFRRMADMRYEGQGHEIIVTLPSGKMGDKSKEEILKNFKDAYRSIYQRLGPSVPIEALNWRLVASGETPNLDLRSSQPVSTDIEEAKKSSRPVYFPIWGEMRPCNIFDRKRLTPGSMIEGPAIVEESESTIVIPPNWSAHMDELLNLILQRKP